MNPTQQTSLNVFFSYAESDEVLRDELVKHLTLLERDGKIRSWDGLEIAPGEDRGNELDAHLAAADLILLLVSPDFFASKAHWEREMQYALAEHQHGRARVVPILLRPVDWKHSPLGALPPLPSNGTPITLWKNRDQAFDKVAQELRNLIGDFESEVPLPPPTMSPKDASETSVDPFASLERAEDVVAICNRAAHRLYRHQVLGEEDPETPATFNELDRLAGRYWGAADYQAQRSYVPLRRKENPEFIQQKAHQMLLDARGNDELCHLWILGNAGTGKTTALYRLYFTLLEEADEIDFQPMLIQPQRLNEVSIRTLREATSAHDLFNHLIQIWLTRRGIDLEEARQQALIQSFEAALRSGRIVLLVDSYDELSRMDLQRDLFQALLDNIKFLICACRPDMYVAGPWHRILRIKTSWDLLSIRDYLAKRLVGRDDLVEQIGSYIAGRDKVAWLRNPRYLDILASMISTRLAQDEVTTGEILKDIESGQYQLFTYISTAALERIAQRFKKEGSIDNEAAFVLQLRQRLQHIAQTQLESGAVVVPVHQLESDPVWKALEVTTELLQVRRDVTLGECYFSFVNFNWIDFFLVDLIQGELLDTTRPFSLDYLWTRSLLIYLGENLSRGASRSHLDTVDHAVRAKLDLYRFPEFPTMEEGFRRLDGQNPRTALYHGINLLQLHLVLVGKRESAEGTSSRVHIEGEEFYDLFLDSIRLRGCSFADCNFSRSLLRNADLEHCTFVECTFDEANFQLAQANFATFENCEFGLSALNIEEGAPSPFTGMFVQDARFTSEGEDQRPTLLRLGARGQKSRYAGPFGRVFREKQREMLGPGLRTADRIYVGAIQAALKSSLSDAPLHLIDLMAGGANQHIIDLCSDFPHLKILAIDRDGSQMGEIVDHVGRRFAMIEKEIQGDLDLESALEDHFQVTKADVVIGKKALHELERKNQPRLLESAARVLRPGGRLVLFVDGPPSITDDGLSQLAQCKSWLLEKDPQKNIEELEAKVNALAFEPTENDRAVFSNLWVHLKDWANGHEHEVAHRYFSSRREIEGWAAQAGLRLCRPPQKQKYFLVARLFNEVGVGQATDLLDELSRQESLEAPASMPQLGAKEIGTLRQALEGGRRFQAFCSMVEAHLWNHTRSRPTAFGRYLGAKPTKLNFQKIHRELDPVHLGLDWRKGIGFQFTVHVMEFEK